MELSVIIVNYNVRNFLEQCLISVNKSSENIDCEIFVVDNNSADGSYSMVSRKFPGVRLIRNEFNSGFSAANNQAIRFASGKYILLLNPDTVVQEDTFRKCIDFMNSHPDAGAVGVQMIDGKGRILPESKRGIPTPKTAFFKIFGLSALFPKSRVYNKYYLGHLDASRTSKAEIISGAFMFMRSEALEKTGLLDEKFFMYGEDIDLSYRLIKAGFNNYYFPEVKIIHYKGESTKKGTLNYILHFYKAMIIFSRKHFENNGFKTFIFFIQLAIYFRAALSVIKRILKMLLLPLTDALLIYLSYFNTIHLWAVYKFGNGYSYPEFYSRIVPLICAFIIVISVTLTAGYKMPARIFNSLKGIIAGTAIILVIYAVLPVDLRFSRAAVIFGGFISLMLITASRIVTAMADRNIVDNPFRKLKRTIIAGDETGFENVKKLLSVPVQKNIIIGRVSINHDDINPESLGNIEQIREVIRVNRIDEVIFTTRLLSASQIIESMRQLSDTNVIIKIAPPGEKFILGSKSVTN